MENKKLVKILTKDMAELEELIAEMKTRGRFDMLEMELIHTRTKGVLHLLQLLGESDMPAVPGTGDGTVILEKLKKNVERVSELTAGIAPEVANTVEETGEDEEKPLPGVIPEPDEEEEEPAKPREEPLPGVVPQPPEEHDEAVVTVDKPFVPVQNAAGDDDNDMLQDEPVRPEGGGRLGDSFLKNKSVNDLINDQVKLEFKLSNRPVSSIQSHIGINDRFLYTRELFDGDSKRFMEAVKTLDSMDNIKEAVDYLRTNFKWKKNETSLKFVNLVKRRFLNATA